MAIGTAEAVSTKQSGLENELLDMLKFSGLQKDNLEELVRIVAGIQSAGPLPFRVHHPIGVPPVVTGLEVQTLLNKTQLPLLEKLMQTPRVKGLVIFPYGIPIPDVFQVNLTIGEGPRAEFPQGAPAGIGG
ncbi:MAG TPA: hypothetical protein VFK06_07365 [Candidatus Angelobacter sp.]|nr:hypothetical protein [Candidatus Angelobacter sp.]